MEQQDKEDDNYHHGDKQGSWYPPIPRFMRTRTVTWDEGGFYRCSCCHFERTGIPCVHIYAVVKMLHPDWKGFSHHDVAVRWWTAYVCHAFPCHGKENSLTARLSNLADCDVKGPVICQLTPPSLDHSSGYKTPHSPVPAYCRVKNYSKEALHQIFGEMNVASSKDIELEMGLTQTTFDPDTTNDDDDDSVNSGGVCNLFEESLKQISKSNSMPHLDDAMRDVEGDFRAIASLLRPLLTNLKETLHVLPFPVLFCSFGLQQHKRTIRNARAQLKGHKELFRRVTIQQEGPTTRISLFTVNKNK